MWKSDGYFWSMSGQNLKVKLKNTSVKLLLYLYLVEMLRLTEFTLKRMLNEWESIRWWCFEFNNVEQAHGILGMKHHGIEHGTWTET